MSGFSATIDPWRDEDGPHPSEGFEPDHDARPGGADNPEPAVGPDEDSFWDFEPGPALPPCPQCFSPDARWVGQLGSRIHWQCRACGAVNSCVPVTA